MTVRISDPIPMTVKEARCLKANPVVLTGEEFANSIALSREKNKAKRIRKLRRLAA